MADNMHFVAMFNFEDLMTLIDMNIREIGLSRVHIVNLVDIVIMVDMADLPIRLNIMKIVIIWTS